MSHQSELNDIMKAHQDAQKRLTHDQIAYARMLLLTEKTGSRVPSECDIGLATDYDTRQKWWRIFLERIQEELDFTKVLTDHLTTPS